MYTDKDKFLKDSPLSVNRILREIFIDTYQEETQQFSPISQGLYPDLSEKDFAEKIRKKKEFYDTRIQKKDEEGLNRNKNVIKTSTQKLIMNFISPETPYNSILLWHGVGSGKTCTAISVAEQFKDILTSLNTKILIILPGEVLVKNWENEIFNIDKELRNTDSSVQCTENIYIQYFHQIKKQHSETIISDRKIDQFTRKQLQSKLPNKFNESDTIEQLRDKLKTQEQDKFKRNIKRSMKKYLETFYEITTYEKLANNLEKIFISMNECDKINYIQNTYSNRIIIMDEIHSQNDVFKKKYENIYLELICRYGVYNKLLLLSATPIKDRSDEILFIINLLRLNEKQGMLEQKDFFKKKKDDEHKEKQIWGIKKKKKKDFQKKINGFISYLRGYNPDTYPVILDPDWNESKQEVYLPQLVVNDIQKNTKEYDNTKLIEFYPFKCYGLENEEFITNYKDKTKDKSEIIKSGYSTIIYPEGTGKFVKARKKKYRANNIFKKEHLEEISPKINFILDQVTKNSGISFIFSRATKSGLGGLAMAFALEANGYNRYVGKKNKDIENQFYPETPESDSEFKGTYIYITSETTTQQKNKLIELSRSYENRNGEIIKVIIGSETVEQGISFFNIRQIHIMEPWWNFSKIEQAIGRGVRNFSHKDLDVDKRNVIIYLHATKETIDEEMYSIAYFKKKKILEVEKLMRDSAIDRCLNFEGNYIENKTIPTITDCFNVTQNDYEINDKDYSFVCNLAKCKKIFPKCKNIKVNPKTFKYNELVRKNNMLEIKLRLQYLLTKKPFYTYNELKEEFNEPIHPYLQYTLYTLVHEKELLSVNDQLGFLIYRKSEPEYYYIFQPLYLSDDIYTANIYVPMYYRIYTRTKDLQQKPFSDNPLYLKDKPIKKKKPKKKVTKPQFLRKFQSIWKNVREFMSLNYLQRDDLQTKGISYPRNGRYDVPYPLISEPDTERKFSDLLEIVIKCMLFDSLNYEEKFEIFEYLLNKINEHKIVNLYQHLDNNIDIVKTYLQKYDELQQLDDNKKRDMDMCYIFILLYGENNNTQKNNEFCIRLETTSNPSQFRLYTEQGKKKVFEIKDEKAVLIGSKQFKNLLPISSNVSHFDNNYIVGYLQSKYTLKSKELVTKRQKVIKNKDKELQHNKEIENLQEEIEQYGLIEKSKFFKYLYDIPYLFNHKKKPDKRTKGVLCGTGSDNTQHVILNKDDGEGGMYNFINRLMDDLHLPTESRFKIKKIIGVSGKNAYDKDEYKKDNRLEGNNSKDDEPSDLTKTFNIYNENFNNVPPPQVSKTLCNDIQFLLRIKHLLRTNEEIASNKMYFLLSEYVYPINS